MPVKTKLEQTSNSIRGTTALIPWHCRAVTLPGQNSGTAAPADNFEAQFKTYERNLGLENLVRFLQVRGTQINGVYK